MRCLEGVEVSLYLVVTPTGDILAVLILASRAKRQVAIEIMSMDTSRTIAITYFVQP